MKERKAVVKSGKPAVASWAAWLCRSMNILISIREKRMNTAVTNAPQYTEVSRAIFSVYRALSRYPKPKL